MGAPPGTRRPRAVGLLGSPRGALPAAAPCPPETPPGTRAGAGSRGGSTCGCLRGVMFWRPGHVLVIRDIWLPGLWYQIFRRQPALHLRSARFCVCPSQGPSFMGAGMRDCYWSCASTGRWRVAATGPCPLVPSREPQRGSYRGPAIVSWVSRVGGITFDGRWTYDSHTKITLHVYK